MIRRFLLSLACAVSCAAAPMDFDTLASAEKLISAVKAHPLAVLAPADERAAAETEVRAAMLTGLTDEQVIKVRKALDTAEERANVAGVLESLVAEDDAIRVLLWLRAECARDIGPSVPDAPVVTTGPPQGAVLFLPATCGWYNSGLEEVRKAIRWLAKYKGRVGLNFEMTGATGNLGVQTKDFQRAYEQHCDLLTDIILECVAAGVPAKFDAFNSNDPGKGWKASWKDTAANREFIKLNMRQVAKELLPVKDWVLVNPVSEDDPSMAASFREECRKLWLDAGWPRSRVCGAGVPESHTGELKSLSRGSLASTDNGPAIERHFGPGVWSAHTPNVERCVAYVKHYLSRGVHASLYHRADRLHLLDHQEAYEQIIARSLPNTAGPDVPAAVTFKMDDPKPQYVSFKGANRSGWATTSIDGKNINGLLKVNDIKCEWIPVGRDNTGLRNALTRGKDNVNVRKGYYQPNLRKGDTVKLEVCRIDGRSAGLVGYAVLTEDAEK